MIQLSTPHPGIGASQRFVSKYLGHLVCDAGAEPSPAFRGGQTSADRALANFDVSGYAKNRNQSYPQTKRRASGLSPWVRHGMLGLQRLWEHVEGGPPSDVEAFRDELLWQEYARHWYARLGAASMVSTHHALVSDSARPLEWDLRMGCIEATTEELEEDGWLVNQTRMWLASHWSVRHRYRWQTGEDYFFRHLLDGSRAANRLGWQWTSGAGSSKQYGFSRWQVEKWAAGLCASCELAAACPIEEWPEEETLQERPADARLTGDDDVSATAGPSEVVEIGPPEAVWITAESLGDDDPAMLKNPDLPVIFVFDEPLLARLELSSKRLIFLTESLADLATRRQVDIWLGDPIAVLGSVPLAATFAPVPGWRRRSRAVHISQTHPWPWLKQPHSGSVASFSEWRSGFRSA